MNGRRLKGRRGLVCTAVTAAIALAGRAGADVCEAWIGGWDDRWSFGLDVGVDAEGNVFVLGVDGASSVLLLKFDRVGRRLWERVNATGALEDLAVDRATGTVYVTGSPSFRDIVTLKYSSAGALEWLRRYEGATRRNWARAIAVDGEGCVLVAGQEDDVNGVSDFLILKYDPSGDLIWVRKINGPANDEDGARDVAVDSADNVYVTGTSETGQSDRNDYLTVKYDREGNELWARRFPAHGQNGAARAVAVGADASVHVTGTADLGYATLKYDTHGDLLWSARESLGYIASQLGVDGQNNLFVTGTGVKGGRDVGVTVKYAPDGTRLWLRELGDPVRDVAAYLLGVDHDGNAFVSGQRSIDGSGAEWVTLEYDPGGDVEWLVTHAGEGGQATPSALALNGAGSPLVVGYDRLPRVTSTVRVIQYARGADVAPMDYEVAHGVAFAGDLFSLEASDNDRLHIAAQRSSRLSEPSVEIIVTSVVPFEPRMRLSFVLEASVLVSGPEQWIDLYDFERLDWKRLDVRDATTNDSVTTVTIDVIDDDPQRFIHPLTGEVHARISFYDPGLPLGGWVARLDRATWDICWE